MVNEISNVVSSDDRFLGFIKIMSSVVNVNHTPSLIKNMIKTVSHAVHVRGAEGWLFLVTVFQSGGTGITTNTIRLTDNEETGSID
tara:strand:- start:188 stop:445 length:258 start_codon:yes stop_codon:yes gene_type:complete